MGQGTNIVMFGGIILIIIFLFKGRSISFSFLIIFYIIFLFGALYSIFLNYYFDYDILRGYRELFIPITLFTIGFLSMDKKKSVMYNAKLIKNFFITISFFLFLYAILNLISHLNLFGEVLIYERKIYDIWSKELVEATAQGSRLTLITSMLIPWILYRQSFSKVSGICIISCALISIISTLIMGNRSLLMILGITLSITFILYLKQNNNDIKRTVQFLIILFIVAVLCIILFVYDIFGVKTFYESSSLYMRMEKSSGSWFEDPRVKAWIMAFVGLYFNPMGGSKTQLELSIPHNLWLDIAYTTGVIPFTLIVIITLFYIFLIIRLFRTDELPESFKIFVCAISIALLLNLMIEPILSGHYVLFMIFMFQLGLIQGLVNKIKSENSG